MITKKFTLLLFTVLLSFTGKCQQGESQYYQNGFYIRQYSEMAGLVNNLCKSVFEDSKDFLWITTFKGLSRFDGKQFTNYGIKEGLPGANITQVSEDSLGFIYVATTTGIARYTGYNKAANSYFHIYAQTLNLGAPILGMQAIDSNTLFFQLSDGAVFLLHEKRLERLIEPAEMGGYYIHRNKNYCYLATRDSVRIFDARTRMIKSIFNRMSFETMDTSGYLRIYDDAKGFIVKIKDTSVVSQRFIPGGIDTWIAFLDTTDKMIYGKSSNIFYYDGVSSSQVINLAESSVLLNGLFPMKDGSVWVTSTGGLFQITPLSYIKKEVQQSSFYCYYVNGKKMIRVGELPNTSPAFLHLATRLKEKIQSVLRDRQSNTWLCTDEGIYKISPAGEITHKVFLGSNAVRSYNDTKVYDAIETPGGDIWFWGGCGAVRYSNGSFRHFGYGNGFHDLTGLVRKLAVTSDESILITDQHEKLHRVQADTVIPVRCRQISNLITNTLVTGPDGNCWIEFNKKIYKIQADKGGEYLMTDSISSLFPFFEPGIKAFEFDLYGNCWVGYNGGIMRVFFKNPDGHYRDSNSITYTAADGLAPTAGIQYFLIADENNNMVLRHKGLKTFYIFQGNLAMERKKLQVLQAGITGILLNNKDPDWVSRGYTVGMGGIPASCKLSYADRDIIFQYTAVSKIYGKGIVYQTMLKGYDDEWKTTTETSADYTNLPAGHYVFKVKAANVNGTWGPVFEYKFTILPPWYKTWWAMLLWILLCISVIVFFLLLRINSIRMHNLKESNLFKSSIIGLIGHDMMTPLKYIAKVSLQLQTYNEKLSKQTTIDSLGEINSTANQLHFFGESMIHWIKTQNSEFSPVIERFYLNKTITELVEFHSPMATEKGNIISNEMPEDLNCCQDQTLLRIILHNLLLNANKFTSKGEIRLSAAMENDWLIINVQDDGRGMDEARVNSLNGFQPIRSSPGTQMEKGWGMGYTVIMDLLRYSRGTLHVKSKLNEGTEVTIKLPCGEINRKEHVEHYQDMQQTYI